MKPWPPIAFLILIYPVLSDNAIRSAALQLLCLRLLALELSRKEGPEEELEFTEVAAPSPGFLPPAHPESRGSY